MPFPPNSSQYQHIHSVEASKPCLFPFCTVPQTLIIRIVNSTSLSLLNMSVNKKSVVGLFWSKHRQVYGRQVTAGCLWCARHCRGPAQLGQALLGLRSSCQRPDALCGATVAGTSCTNTAVLIGEPSSTAASRDSDTALRKPNRRQRKERP